MSGNAADEQGVPLATLTLAKTSKSGARRGPNFVYSEAKRQPNEIYLDLHLLLEVISQEQL